MANFYRASKAGRPAKPAAVIDVPVDFGGVSIGDRTARLGIKISRQSLSLEAADSAFCGHRLTGQVVLGRNGDSPGQGVLFDMETALHGTFDVKRLGCDADQISTGLTYSLADIDVAELAKFSKGVGRLVVNEIGELPEDEPGSDDEDSGSRAAPPVVSEGPWRDVELSTLFDGMILKSMKKAGITTVGSLSDYTAGDQRLTDLDGIGPGKAQQIEERMLKFWVDNPQYAGG